jgi:hypothetical protein
MVGRGFRTGGLRRPGHLDLVTLLSLFLQARIRSEQTDRFPTWKAFGWGDILLQARDPTGPDAPQRTPDLGE